MRKSIIVIMCIHTMLLQGMEQSYKTSFNTTELTITTQPIHEIKDVDFIIVGDNQQWLLRQLYEQGKMENNHIVKRIGEVLPVSHNRIYISVKDKDEFAYIDFNNQNRNNDLLQAIEEKKITKSIVFSVVEPCILYDKHDIENELDRYYYTKQTDFNSIPYKKHGIKAFKLAQKDLPGCYENALHTVSMRAKEQNQEPCSIALHVLGASTGIDNYTAFIISLKTILDYIKKKPLAFKEIYLCVKNDYFFNSGKTILSFFKLYEDLPAECKDILSLLQPNQGTSYALNSYRPTVLESGFFEDN